MHLNLHLTDAAYKISVFLAVLYGAVGLWFLTGNGDRVYGLIDLLLVWHHVLRATSMDQQQAP